MEYELFLYTKTIMDDWKFHIVPSAISKSEQDELRNSIVTGLYAQFPSIARSDVENYIPKNIGVISNFCYCLPFNEHTLILVLVRISKIVDYTGRPFWDFVGAYIPKQKISLQEWQSMITQLLTEDILFKTVDEFLDQTKPAPQLPHKSRTYTLNVNPLVDVSINDIIKNAVPEENPFSKHSKEMLRFDSTKHEDFQILINQLNDKKKPSLFFAYGPVDKGFFTEKISAFQSISKPDSQLSRIPDADPQITNSNISDINTRRHLLFDLITTTLSYSLGFVDTIVGTVKKTNKKDDPE